MSTTATEEVACPECAVRQNVLVVESANIQRFPNFKKQVLDGTFMRFTCVSCKASFIIEADMLYTDYDDKVFMGVFPRGRRANAAECESLLEATYQQVFVKETPAYARTAVGGDLERRVVFGYEELREKVVCFSARLDDHIVEAMKIALTDAKPDVGKLSLQLVDDDYLWFARVGTSEAPFAVRKAMYEALHADTQKLQMVLQPLWGGSYVSAEKCLAA